MTTERGNILDIVPTDLYIDGAFRPASDGGRFDVHDPATGDTIASVAAGTVDDSLAAVAAAHEALAAWGATAPRQRAEILRRAFELMTERSEEIAELIVRENGKSFADAAGETAYAAEFFRWYAEEAVRSLGSVSTAPGGDKKILVLHQPVGVAVLVTPWNFPAAMATRKIAPALAAGCTVILKPASETPLTALLIAQILEDAGVPPGVVNVLPSERAGAVVSAMLHDPRVRKVSFTGSTEVGRILLREAADNVVNTSMELGGNAPFLVFDDADLDAAVDGAMVAKMRNGGEDGHDTAQRQARPDHRRGPGDGRRGGQALRRPGRQGLPRRHQRRRGRAGRRGDPWTTVARRRTSSSTSPTRRSAAAVAHTVEAFGSINVLLNNAGINKPLFFLDITEENYEQDHGRQRLGQAQRDAGRGPADDRAGPAGLPLQDHQRRLDPVARGLRRRGRLRHEPSTPCSR
jgi:hypothetical protein